MTPFFGGMLADRLLGARRAVVLGGLLMAAGHLLMTVQTRAGVLHRAGAADRRQRLFQAEHLDHGRLALSARAAPKRDGGFTIFYMGINLGAAMSPLLCGYIGETYGWHYGFGLATIGMLAGLAVFVAPPRVTQIVIGGAALLAAAGLLLFRPDNALLVRGQRVRRGRAAAGGRRGAASRSRAAGCQPRSGAPPDARAAARAAVGRPADRMARSTSARCSCVPVFALLVSGFSPFNERRAARAASRTTDRRPARERERLSRGARRGRRGDQQARGVDPDP